MEFEWVPSTEVLCNPEILYVSKASDGVNVLRRFYPRGRNLMWCCHSNIMKRYDCCTSNEKWLLLIEWSLHVWQCWNRVYSGSIILPLFVCPMTRTLKDGGAWLWNGTLTIEAVATIKHETQSGDWWLSLPQSCDKNFEGLWNPHQFSRVWPSINQVL